MSRVRPRHVRHREFDHLRYSTYFLDWLSQQSERLGITARELFDDYLVKAKMTFMQIEMLEPSDPEPPEQG